MYYIEFKLYPVSFFYINSYTYGKRNIKHKVYNQIGCENGA